MFTNYDVGCFAAQYVLNDKSASLAFDNDSLLKAELTGQYERALSVTDTILNSLERRSLSWETAMGTFAHNTLLTRGTTIGVSDPFLGIVGWSFTIELSALSLIHISEPTRPY